MIEKETRPNSRCFRYSDRSKKILENINKDNLNDAFNKIIVDAYYSENERKEKIKELDKIIASRETTIKKLNSKIDVMESILQRIEYFKSNVEDLDRDIKNISKDLKKVNTLK